MKEDLESPTVDVISGSYFLKMDLKYVLSVLLFVSCEIFKGIFASKKTSDVCPGNNWAQLGTTCYYFISVALMWNAAETDCESRGGTLLIFEKPDEVAKVFKEIRKIASQIDTVALFWLGVHNQEEDGVFRWADGRDVTRPSWKKKLEEATGGNCVVIMSDRNNKDNKRWELRNCTEQLPYVCEIRLSTARWSGWGIWSDCSVSCGDGSRTRKRTCLRVSAASGECTGEAVNTEQCSKKCTVEATWGKWSEWDECSKSCGKGKKQRTRTCLNSSKGNSCTGKSEEMKDCLPGACPTWSSWERWSDCSVTCGSGTRSRTRSCSVDGQCQGKSTESKVCSEESCQVQATWAEWSEWSQCSKSCGKGKKQRTRTCLNSSKGNSCTGKSEEMKDCLPGACPTWSSWERWSDCSVTCGSGTRSRTRSCSVDGQCQGKSTESKVCSEKSCQVQATWAEWSEWSQCSKSCGKGKKQRTRTCLNSSKGNSCTGKSEEMKDCLPGACPTWSSWERWSDCSVTCGSGTRSRTRSCSVDGQCQGKSTESKVCSEESCQVQATWAEWSEWSQCSKSCGKGKKQRTRTCLNSSKGNSCTGKSEEMKDCLPGACPNWGQWESWSSCSVTCDKGEISRSRTCTGGDSCRGQAIQTKNCKMPRCLDRGEWTTWDIWGTCSVTCGVGKRTRERYCKNGYGDAMTTCKGNNMQFRRCLTPCRDASDVEKLMKKALPEEVKYLKKIKNRIENKKLKEEIFNSKDMDNFIIEGYEIKEVKVNRPLACVRKCMKLESCKSFNYEDITTNGENDLNVLKNCTLNSISKDDAQKRGAVRRKNGYKLFDLEPFFVS